MRPKREKFGELGIRAGGSWKRYGKRKTWGTISANGTEHNQQILCTFAVYHGSQPGPTKNHSSDPVRYPQEKIKSKRLLTNQ